jgi:phospholipid-binding lipoprotein MlaA
MSRAGGWAEAMALLLPLLASACGVPRDASMPVRDPHEEINRYVMAANLHVLRPVSEAVKATVPSPVRDRVHDFNSNLKEPRIFVNNILQFRLNAAARTATRFVLNSAFGIGGLFDIANREGLPPESGDFGQTLFVWGVSEGPYVVRPPIWARPRFAMPWAPRSIWSAIRLAGSLERNWP